LAKLFHFAEKDQVATWLFRVGNAVFIVARFLTVILAVLTFWFGLEPYASQALRYVNLGIFFKAVLLIGICLYLCCRISGLAFVGGLQSYLLFQFAIFQARRLRSKSAPIVAPKSPKKVKKSAKELSDLPEVDQNTRNQALSKKVKQK